MVASSSLTVLLSRCISHCAYVISDTDEGKHGRNKALNYG